MSRTRSGRRSRQKDPHLQKGQVLVIVVFAITALVAIIGLVADLGLVFIQYGRLRRAVDSAALAASLQYRENYTIDSLEASAVEFLTLNGINDPSAVITVCDYDEDLVVANDAAGEEGELCDGNGNGDNDGVIEPDDGELRKFVHVIARTNAQLAFLTVLPGFPRSVPLAAEAISEAASLDVVIIIDRSESMTNQPGNEYTKERDPRYCNSVVQAGGWQGDCHSFHEVKKAAYDFVSDNLFFPYDRAAIITFDHNARNGDDDTNPGLSLTSERDTILTRIKQLTVYDPQENIPDDATVLANYATTAHTGGCEDHAGGEQPCRGYVQQNETDYMFQQYFCDDITTAQCTTSNIGGALLFAGNEFADERWTRPEALWVVILIADGLANSSVDIANSNQHNIYCPNPASTPYCNDGDPDARHCLNNAPANEICIAKGGVVDVTPNDGIQDYDSDDFGRDMADFVGIGQQALIFTIGLSDLVRNCQSCDVPDTGEQFLEYAAEVGNGEYFYAPSGDDLRDIFREIADNIAVRLTH